MVILAAGLTPAWQQILSFASFQPGEVNRFGASALPGYLMKRGRLWPALRRKL